jgi:hypothetical protein
MPSPPSIAPPGIESSDVGRSYRLGSALPGVVGDTIDATLMLLAAGDTSGCGIRFDVMGDGVLSVVNDVRCAEWLGLRMLAPNEAAEVSVQTHKIQHHSSHYRPLLCIPSRSDRCHVA